MEHAHRMQPRAAPRRAAPCVVLRCVALRSVVNAALCCAALWRKRRNTPDGVARRRARCGVKSALCSVDCQTVSTGEHALIGLHGSLDNASSDEFHIRAAVLDNAEHRQRLRVEEQRATAGNFCL